MTKIRIRHGEHEIEVEGTDKFIQSHLEQFYERLELVGQSPLKSSIKRQLLDRPSSTMGKEAPTPAEFYRSKGKTDGLSQVLIFGKYLELYRNVTEFSPGDLNKIATEAKLSRNIHPQYIANAVRQGLLRKLGRKYSLTLSAEEVLASM